MSDRGHKVISSNWVIVNGNFHDGCFVMKTGVIEWQKLCGNRFHDVVSTKLLRNVEGALSKHLCQQSIDGYKYLEGFT